MDARGPIQAMPNFSRLDIDRPDVAILIEAMSRAREAIGARSWSSPQEPLTAIAGGGVLKLQVD
jgi:hypothetical protein